MIPARPPKPGDHQTLPQRPPKPRAPDPPTQASPRSPAYTQAHNLHERPSAAASLPILADLQEEEMARLLADPETLEALYLTHSHTAQARHQQHLALLQQEQALQARITTLHTQANQQYKQACDAVSAARAKEDLWNREERAMYAALQPTTADALFTRLQAATTDAEKMSEALLASFLEGEVMSPGGGEGDAATEASGLAVGAFMKEYRQLRQVYHLRSEKLARWKEGRVGGFR
ncbi:hypothetical protein BCR37DRAFT_227502 [Protomyces lactucae-debilis]|uniref:VPS37 C-terminal domain-containing protein n=1 Tax=Protomyces lactucae-debilis TaxID=2754530 RepID=A0A1Y2ERI7_PROLT|nr:uncharacterized protein BCR37DRAFT_227502 [Protomyces lactucae-debilis]ORY74142.1 hypothetical protein BCR37DRAFT_227502 [Protomyces lactucae-debilis]